MYYILILCSILISQGTACPKIISRQQWGASSANTARLPTVPAPFVVIHHTAGKQCTTDTQCRQEMRRIQSFHINANRWADIGYNFLIGDNGFVYEGRGWRKQGAHAPNYNTKSVGISFIGTFTNKLPTASAINAAKSLIACGVSKKEIRYEYSLIGHRQAISTECPGSKLYAEIKKWPRFRRLI